MSTKKGVCKYIDIPISFDTETTSTVNSSGEKIAFMYIWMINENGDFTYGRTWMEFAEWYVDFIKRYSITLKNRAVIYIHNAAFDFQFFRCLFEWENIFALDERKVVYAVTKQGVEFRCSYILTNKPLALLANEIGLKKMVGDLDYNIVRHSNTPLTETEMGYCREDVHIVTEYIKKQIEIEGGISKIPLTATGYVRRDVKKNCAKNKKYRRKIKELTLEVDEYIMLKQAFMGGYTHCNPYHMGKINTNVTSYDFTSAYPAVMLSEMFPMSKGQKVTVNSIEDFLNYLRYYCCVFNITFYNISRKENIPDDYIPASKCSGKMIIENNGRVNSAKEISLSITDIDFKIISSVYEWEDIKIGDMYIYCKGYLPKEIVESTLQYYKLKTELKGIAERELEYQINKGYLNSIYGMMVTDPLRDEIIYENDSWGTTNINLEEGIEKYNKSGSRFLAYPWGIWITAYNRYNLWRAIIECGNDYIYSDTDSIKLLNIEKHMNFFNTYNKEITYKVKLVLSEYNINIDSSEPEDKKHIKHPIGVWDFDGSYDKFKSLGAKRYMYVIDGKLSMTISGVNKKSALPWLQNKYGTVDSILENFKEGLVFPPEATGKLTHTYLDQEMNEEIEDYLGNKYTISEFSGVHLTPADYTLSISEKYKNFIRNAFTSK